MTMTPCRAFWHRFSRIFDATARALLPRLCEDGVQSPSWSFLLASARRKVVFASLSDASGDDTVIESLPNRKQPIRSQVSDHDERASR